MVSQESPWAVSCDQHSHAGQMSVSPRHSDCVGNIILVCGPMQKPEIIDLQNSVSYLCGGPVAGCCFPDVMNCWLALRQEINTQKYF